MKPAGLAVAAVAVTASPTASPTINPLLLIHSSTASSLPLQISPYEDPAKRCQWLAVSIIVSSAGIMR